MQNVDMGWRAGEPRELGNGLRLRWSRAQDTEGIAQLVGHVFRDHEGAAFNEYTAYLAYELMSGRHPLMGPGDFLLVEDSSSAKPEVVATTCYWHHTWEFGDVPLRVGRPEIVATHPAYRQRGLIRALFQEIHRRSQAEGDFIQGITGIPYFYRQFGYEYALELSGGRFIPLANLSGFQTDLAEPFLLRDATEEDLPLLASLYEQSMRAELVRTRIEESWWRYQLANWQTSRTGEHWHIQMIVDQAQKVWGYLVTPVKRLRSDLGVWAMGLLPGANGLAILPSVLRALLKLGLQMPTGPAAGGMTGITFYLSGREPVCGLLDTLFAARPARPYAWYIRVADLPGFVRKIAPVLEKRLAQSPLSGYAGSLKLDFHRGGLNLVFEQGRLALAENWRSPWPGQENAGFPPLVFLQLLLGYRSLDELLYSFPDVRAKDEAALVLQTLFPRQPSFVVPLG